VHDVYFDCHSWSIRYLVLDTGRWLPGRKVLLTPEVIQSPWHAETALPVTLTKDQVQSSPEMDETQPISRHYEQMLHTHYEWMPYWEVAGMPGPLLPPIPVPSVEGLGEEPEIVAAQVGTHLCSARQIRGFHVRASDEEAGEIVDLLFDDDLRC